MAAACDIAAVFWCGWLQIITICTTNNSTSRSSLAQWS